MGQLGYRTVLVFCGFLALPGGISCCLAGAIPCSGDEGDCSASSRGTKSPDAETKQDESPIDIFLGEIELVEGEDIGQRKREAMGGGTLENVRHSLRLLDSHFNSAETVRYAGVLPAQAAL